jgi:hypothetical protein
MSEAGEGRARPSKGRQPGGRGPQPPGAPPQPAAGTPGLRLLNVGYGNVVVTSRVVAILSAQSKPMRRLRDEAEARLKLLDATQGRKTRSILVLDSDHVVLSALNPETMAARLTAGEGAGTEAGAP